MNAYFMSQFGYCSLVWMKHSITLNNHINGLRKSALSLIYNDVSRSFSEFLEKDKSETIHHRNFQTEAYEIFKVIFPKKESNYSLRNSTSLQGRSIKYVMCGSETVSSLEPKTWDILPTDGIDISSTFYRRNFKNCVSCIITKKKEILRKTYVQNIEFL